MSKMSRSEKAIENFRGKYNCSQSVLLSYSDLLGINEEISQAVASGFGGGIAQNKKMCGALTGAIMVIGLRYFDSNDIQSSKEKVYRISNELLKEFMDKNHSLDCKDLYDENKIKVLKESNNKILYPECEKYISEVCDILDKYF